MKRLAFRLTVALLTFAVGLASASLAPRPRPKYNGPVPARRTVSPPSASACGSDETDRPGGAARADAVSLDNRGDNLRARGCFAEAADAYSSAISADPSFAIAYDDLANTDNFLGRYDEARDAALKGLRVSSDDAFLANELGYAYWGLGRYEEAAAAFRKAEGAEPDDAFAHATLGEVYFKLGRYGEASAEAERGVQLGERRGDDAALGNAGAALADLGRYDEAISAFERARELAPGEVSHHLELGCAYELNGRRDEAVASFARAAEQNAVTPYDYQSRAWALLYVGEGHAAAEAAREYLDRVSWRGHDAPYVAVLAYAGYRQAGETDEAARVVAEASRRCDGSDWAREFFRYLRREETAEELLSTAKTVDERIDAHTFAGLVEAFDGRGREAAAHLRWVRDHAARGDVSYPYVLRLLRDAESAGG